MPASKTHAAAVDLGATSGRVIVGSYSNDGLELTEAHRFPNGFHEINGYAYWDIGRLVDEVREGLRAAKKLFPELASCGVCTWGVDYAMLDGEGRLVFPIHAYRDRRIEPLREKLIATGEDRKLYEWTGLPPVAYNSGIQLKETVDAFPQLREMVERVLFLPDYFNYLLTGEQVNEVSIVSTTQLLEVGGMNYSREALEFFGLPEKWFSGPHTAGRRLGRVCGIQGLDTVETVLVPGHDTSSAFEAIPQIGRDIFVSAGTWLLVGGLTDQPAAGEAGYRFGVSNERTGDGGYRPNKILLGLWLLEQLLPGFGDRPANESEWSALIEGAEGKNAPGTLIDTGDRELFNPADMRAAIDANLKRQGVSPPGDLAGYTRLICDSLGRSVADATLKFGEMTGTEFDNIVIVGGGSKNRLLCQRLADFAKLPVTSYVLEGTAVGNIGYQLLGMGVVESMDAFRAVVGKGLNKRTFEPRA